ncbi:MAG TPA: ABC transporter permease, partial [Vicinamibacterales bacterium]|nr:ABC transporter permease [Vicinamibacterales bacterium]
TIALLVVTTTMVNGYLRARRGIMGFETRPLLSARVDNPGGVSASHMLEVLRGMPGVETAAAATAMPFRARGPNEPVARGPGTGAAISAERVAISPSFVEALGITIRAGRTFVDGEPASMRTVVVNEALASRLFPDRSPVGASIWIGGAAYDVVGVVADYSNNPMQDASGSPRLFLPLQEMPRSLSFLVRANDPAALVRPVRAALRDAAAGNVVAGVGTYDQVIRIMGQEMMVGTAPLFPLIGIGMLLTMAGIYGVLAFAVARRARELAVRVALGATERDLARLVTMQTVRLAGVGIVLGLGLMFGLATIVRAGGGAGSVFDPSLSAFVAPAAAIMGIAVAATWLPARRAASIEPATLLRAQ